MAEVVLCGVKQWLFVIIVIICIIYITYFDILDLFYSLDLPPLPADWSNFDVHCALGTEDTSGTNMSYSALTHNKLPIYFMFWISLFALF